MTSNHQSLINRIKIQLEVGKKAQQDVSPNSNNTNNNVSSKNNRKDTSMYSSVKKSTKTSLNTTILISDNYPDAGSSLTSKNANRRKLKLNQHSQEIIQRDSFLNSNNNITPGNYENSPIKSSNNNNSSFILSGINTTTNHDNSNNDIILNPNENHAICMNKSDILGLSAINNNNTSHGGNCSEDRSSRKRNNNTNTNTTINQNGNNSIINASSENLSYNEAIMMKFSNAPKQYLDNMNSILDSEELKFTGPQQEIIKKILDEFKTIGDVLNECHTEAIKRTNAFQEELTKLRKDNKELKDEIKKLKVANEEYDIIIQQKDDEIGFLKSQGINTCSPLDSSGYPLNSLGNNRDNIVNHGIQGYDSVNRNSTANLIENKRKTQARFIKPRKNTINNENQNLPNISNCELSKKLQELQYENYMLRNENKSLWLQNRKAMELAIENKKSKILRLGQQQLDRTPSKSPNKTENPLSLDTSFQAKKSLNGPIITNFNDNSENHNISFALGTNNSMIATMNSNNSRLQSAHKSRKSNNPMENNLLVRTRSLEAVQNNKRKKVGLCAFK